MDKLTLAMRNTSNISLPPSLRQAINRRVESGRYQSAGEVVQEALHLLDERDKSRQSALVQLRAEIAVGLTQAAAGEFSDGKDVLRRILKKAKSTQRKIK
jgi:antitoxin ParD1/3/4